jgi:hypothetical protein
MLRSHCALILSPHPDPVIARNEEIHCGLSSGPWIATALRASQ